MKESILTMRCQYFYLVVISFMVVACTDDARHNLVLSQYQYDFGSVKQGDLCTGHVKVYNKGIKDIHISQVKGDCGCTTVYIDRHTIVCNDSTTLHFTLDTKNKQGDIENFIIIEANTDSVVHYVQVLATVE